MTNRNNIINLVCKYSGVSVPNLFKNSRKTDIIIARQMSMYLLRKKLGLSYSEIGKIMAREGKAFDHTSAMSNVRVFKDRLDTREEAVIVPYEKVVAHLEKNYEASQDDRPKLVVYYEKNHSVHSIVKVLNSNFESLAYDFE